MDDFEKNIKEHKDFFDDPAPNKSKMWANIEARLPDAREKKLIPIWKRSYFRLAASIALIIGLGLFLNFQSNQRKIAATHSSEFLEVTNHYGKLVAYQIEKLNASNELSAQEKEEFLDYIRELESEQYELKIELERNLDNEEVLEAIIKNFNQQINLIEQLLNRLNQSKRNKNETGISL